MEFFVGFDVDPVAHQIAKAQINNVLDKDSSQSRAHLQVHTLLKNFKSIKASIHDIDANLSSGVQGILMDLGMSSMQVYWKPYFLLCLENFMCFLYFLGMYLLCLLGTRVSK